MTSHRGPSKSSDKNFKILLDITSQYKDYKIP